MFDEDGDGGFLRVFHGIDFHLRSQRFQWTDMIQDSDKPMGIGSMGHEDHVTVFVLFTLARYGMI